jgi:hypothetical protein
MTSGSLLSLSQLTTFLQGMLTIGVKHPLGRFHTAVSKRTEVREIEQEKRCTIELR